MSHVLNMYQPKKLIVGNSCEYVMNSCGKFITGTDILIDDGTTASYWYDDLSFMRNTMGN